MEHIENELKPFFLKNVEFRLNGKILRKGRIKIVNTKQFFIKIKLDSDKESKEFELPYPYKTRRIKDGLVFDYCLSSFAPQTEEFYWKMKTLDTSNSSKLHENYLYIVALSS